MDEDAAPDFAETQTQRLDELHIWIVMYGDGSEGVVLEPHPTQPDGSLYPLMHPNLELARRQAGAARLAGAKAESLFGPPVTVELRSYQRKYVLG